MTDSETDTKGLPQFHSIGIQVEDKKRYVAEMKESVTVHFLKSQLESLHFIVFLVGMGGSSAPTV